MRTLRYLFVLAFIGVTWTAAAACVGGIDGAGNYGGAVGGTNGGIGIGGNH